MRTYVKYAVRPGSATKAKKFNLKFDPEKICGIPMILKNLES